MSKQHCAPTPDHELSRFDDEGGHLSHPHRAKAAKKRFERLAARYCRHYAFGTSETQLNLLALLAAYNEWQSCV